MNILLTGGSGQVGQALQRSLSGMGTLIVPGRAQLDLADPDAIRRCVAETQPALIINAGAYTAVDQAESEPALAQRINGDAPGVLAESAKAIGAALIHYSTDYVFDGTKQGAWTEDDVPAPLSVYGRTKLAGEQAIAAAGISHLILRTSWVYGREGKNFLLTMLRLAQTRDALSIVDDQIGAPTWSTTIAEATAAILRVAGGPAQLADYTGLYHLCAQGQTSWYGFAQAIFSHPAVTHRPRLTAIPSEAYPTAAMRPKNSVMSTEKFRRHFGTLPAWDAALNDCLRSPVPVESVAPAR